MVKCRICGKHFKIITNTHLIFVHRCKIRDYTRRFGTKNCGFLSPNLLPKHDPRYKKWRESLKKRPPIWSKGYTKETHPSILKISRTFKEKRIDNFSKWREKMKKIGKIRSNFPPFKQSRDLAELIGVILGDGHIEEFPRTESLTIVSNSNNQGFIKRYSELVMRLFDKKPHIARTADSINCTRIRIYQKYISKRLEIPAGNRSKIKIKIPEWIFKEKTFLIRYLRGLYEAEGSFCVHKPTYTYKFLFSNRNKSLLENVYRALKTLDFHPHRSSDKIQISKKEEVYKIKDLLKFRQY